jgi:hypothetical protein
MAGHRDADLRVGSAVTCIVWIEHRHAWNARGALAYLLSLRTALQHNSSQGSSG